METWKPAIYITQKGEKIDLTRTVEVSDKGNVRKSINHPMEFHRGGEIKVYCRNEISGNGAKYRVIKYPDSDNAVRTMTIHRLMMSTFHPEGFQVGYDVHHKDSVQWNNDIDNLQWISREDHIKLTWGTDDD